MVLPLVPILQVPGEAICRFVLIRFVCISLPRTEAPIPLIASVQQHLICDLGEDPMPAPGPDRVHTGLSFPKDATSLVPSYIAQAAFP